jgi:predicted transposase YbfD/YdcC
VTPTEVGFPHAETIIKVVRSSTKQTKKPKKIKKSKAKKSKAKKLKAKKLKKKKVIQTTSTEVSYYISSIPRDKYTEEQWMRLIRGHWGGIEIRNHWRKDACLLEDATRSRNPNIVACLAMLRNCYLYFFEEQDLYDSLPALTEAIAADSNMALRMIKGRF